MKAQRREEVSKGSGPTGAVTSMKAQSGAKSIKGAVGIQPKATGLGMIKGATTCPNSGGKSY